MVGVISRLAGFWGNDRETQRKVHQCVVESSSTKISKRLGMKVGELGREQLYAVICNKHDSNGWLNGYKPQSPFR